MKVTKQIRREARQLFRRCASDGQVDEARVRQVVARVIEEKGRGYLGLLAEFHRLVRLHRAEHTAEVETAVTLPDDLQATVRTRLQKTYGEGIEIRFEQKPELIGGMRIKVGSDVYDGSVKAELDELERRF